MPTPAAPRRKGAQPGNANALRHGFYSNSFQFGELADLDTALNNDLQDEITMLRVITRRVMALSSGDLSLDEAINALGALGLSSTRLAGLLRTQRILNGEDAGAIQAISDALTQINIEMGLT